MKRVKRAISVARRVMEETQHTLIVGDDATRFAVRMGFEETSLTNVRSQTRWEEWAATGEKTDAFDPEPFDKDTLPGHDTVGSIAVDAQGNLCVGCSTNGREFKIAGRVGDSPIPGAGAYGDQEVGLKMTLLRRVSRIWFNMTEVAFIQQPIPRRSHSSSTRP